MEYIDHFLSECSFGLELAALTHCWPDWHEDPHTPGFNRLYYIMEGEGRFDVGGQTFYPKAGDMVLLPAGQEQAFGHINENHYLKYWCHFRVEAHGARLFDLFQIPYCLSVGNAEELIGHFERLVSFHSKPGAAAAMHAKASLLELLSAYLERAGQSEPQPLQATENSEPSAKLRQLGVYISDHLEEELTLEKLAAQLHFHPNYFIVFFKRYFGVPPLRYVSNLRMEKAKSLLKSTSLPIAEIAGKTGYRDLHHFSRRFKEQTGYSPSDFRKT